LKFQILIDVPAIHRLDWTW